MTLIDKAGALAAIEAWFAETKSFAPPSLLDAIAALPAQGVRVKPLVWEGMASPAGFTQYQTHSGFGTFKVQQVNGKDYATLVDPEGRITRHPAIDAAKAAAQANYERRILAALAPARGGRGGGASPTRCVPDLQRIVDNAKTAPQWDVERDRLAPCSVDAPVPERPFIIGANHGYETAMEQVAEEARRYAQMYDEGSDGRNTFTLFAEWAEQAAFKLADLTTEKTNG